MMEAALRLGREECAAMQRDSTSLRAEASVPHLLGVLSADDEPRVREASGHLGRWDFRVEPDRIGATLFNAFFAAWTRAVAGARFEGETAELLAGGLSGLAARLLSDGPDRWFPPR